MKKIIIYLLLFLPFLNSAQGSGSSILLNGSNQYVSIPYSMELNPSTEITIEAWFKHTQTFVGVGTEAIILKSFTSHANPYYQYGLTTDGSNAGDKHFKFFLTTSDNALHVVSTPNDFYTVGEWYHISGTYDGSNMKLYINGELISTLAVSGNIASFNTGVEIGALINYAPSRTPGEYDELKIWNKALSQAEIRSNMTKKTTSSHPYYSNLVAYYNSDSGTGSTLIDQSSNGNDGTLINNPTWQTSSAPIGDNIVFATNVSTGSSLNLSNDDGSNFKVNIISGMADTVFIYNVSEEPNVVAPPSGLDQLSQTNYWGVKAFGSSSLVYEVVYNYEGHAGISDENNLRLCSRADNATNSWVLETATLDTGANTLSLGGQIGTEFILGGVGGNTLSVNESELKDYRFFPNPTSDFLKFPNGEYKNSNYQIFDVKGSKLLEGNIRLEDKINVRSLSGGLYFLKFDNSISYKFIKS
jgi:hypothetical protein